MDTGQLQLNMKKLKQTIEQLTTYLEPFLPLANVHMVDYFTKDVYKSSLPLKIREEINRIGIEEAIQRIFNNNYTDLPCLNSYAKKSEEFTLKNLEVCTRFENLSSKLLSLGCSDLVRFKLNVFMTSKKSHEVDIFSYVAAAVQSISGTSHLIDIGDGKGYLSSFLALHHKLPVLGVDASQINTNSAVTRVKKLSRIWTSEVNKLQLPTVTDTDDKVSPENKYKQVTKFVDEKTDFFEIVSNVFLEKPNGLGFIGLHTCGNLAPTCLKIFTADTNIKTLCNVGCCYHFLSEAHEEDQNYIKSKVGFPMSDYLSSKSFKIGRAGRMIAAQSMERILERREMPNVTIFYRALFQIFLQKEFSHLPSDKKQVGRFRKKPKNFLDYTKISLKRLKLNTNLDDGEIENLFNVYKERECELYLFFLIRNMLSPIIESLILMDRLLYLLELGFEKSYLVQFFDPVVSPRCYGLIAIK